MTMIAIPETNLNEVEAWDGSGGGLVPPGEYVFDVSNVTLGESSKGNPQLEFDLTIVAGAESEVYNGRELKHWLSLMPKAAGRVRNFVDACGVELDAKGRFDDQEFVGKQFIAEVYSDTYEKVDPSVPSGKIVKPTTRIRKERLVSAGFTGQEAEAPAPTPSKGPTLRASAPAATAPTQQPRVAGATFPKPGMRVPTPVKR